ncbi:MAG: hypothetical protein NTY13_00300, partial [Chlamydiae bacterium]|nr:hypothetical protein [Chlamydiota bacterium]
LAKSLKSVLYFFIFFWLTLSLPAFVFDQVQKTASLGEAHVEEKASYMFVLRADTGVITKTNGGYKLTLKGVDDKVLYFSDRPVRKAGYITITQFMGNWAKGNDSFKANPPNAAIVHAALKTNEKGIAQVIPVEMTNPVITAQGWTFDLNGLGGEGLSVGSYKVISVFIDQNDPTSDWNTNSYNHELGYYYDK